MAIEFFQLGSSDSGELQGLSFGGDLADQARILGFRGVEAAAGQQEIANYGVADVAFQARDAAEAGNQAEAKFGESKAGHLVGNDEIAYQGKLEAASKTDAVYGRHGCDWGGVDGVQYMMNTLKKLPGTTAGFRLCQLLHPFVKFAQVGAGRKAGFKLAV